MRSNIIFKTFISLLVASLTSLAIFSGILLAASLVLLDDNPAWEQSVMFSNEVERQLVRALGQADVYDDLLASYDEPLPYEVLEEDRRRLDGEISLLEERLDLLHIKLTQNSENHYVPVESDAPSGTIASGDAWSLVTEAVYESSVQEFERVQETLMRELEKVEGEVLALINRRAALSLLRWEGSDSAWDFILLRENDALTNRRDLLPPNSPLTIHSISLGEALAAAQEQHYSYSLADGQLHWEGGVARLQPRTMPVEVQGFAFTPKIRFNIDGFHGAWLVWHALHGKFLPFLLTTIVSAVAAILLMVWLFSASGYVSETAADGSHTSHLKLSWFDHIPFDLLLLVFLIIPLAALGGSQILWRISAHLIPFDTRNVATLSQIYDEAAASQLLQRFGTLAFLLLFVAVLMFGILLLSVIRRVKLRRFLRTTICGSLVLLLLRGIRAGWRAFSSLATRPRLLLVAVVWILSVPIAILLPAAGYRSFVVPVTLYFVTGFLLLLNLYRRQLDSRDRFEAATSALAAGDIEVEMQAPGMPVWDDITRNLDSIEAGVRQAVEERMQSERLKTELITNVSHDLKTPLTSIINYIDLLHRPGLSEEERAGCLAVLTQKSQQLKRLTEDLVEASKASSGALQIQLEAVDIVELLQQAAGEYQERMKQRQLTLILHLPPGLQALEVQSDSRHLWRILENILGNAAKYALPGSRVHVTLLQEAETWAIRVRNVSEQPIDLSTAELMERFVRGDRSRSSEGSGLGLAIARGLSERLGGALSLAVEQDLFTVNLSFPNEDCEAVMRPAAADAATTTVGTDGAGIGTAGDSGRVSESTEAEVPETVARPGAVPVAKSASDAAGTAP